MNTITAAILIFASAAIGHFPPIQRDPNQPITKEKSALGHKLFFDKRVSAPDRDPATGRLVHTISCATCHHSEHGGADGRPVAVGINGRQGTRNSPSIINAIYIPLHFWDMRAIGARNQALLPIVNPDEMGQQTEGQVLRRLNGIPGYRALCQIAYGTPTITREIFADAIVCFESELLSFNAPVDKRMAGDVMALSPDAEIGYGIFQRSNCAACHKPPFFTDFAPHNNGAAFFFGSNDIGRAGVLPANRRPASSFRAFKTPQLREIARTNPYLHNGSVVSLDEMVHAYNIGMIRGGLVDGAKDRRIQPLGLTVRQEKYLVTFLKEGFASPDFPWIKEPQLP